jgi:uncharacterized protein YjeT (DUF2065 family)
MTSGQRGLAIGRLLLAVAVGVVLVEGFVYVAAPKSTGVEPVFGNPAGSVDGGVPAGLLTLAVAIVLVVVGLVWMIRIHRADPEPDQRNWRYRERD